VDYYVGEESLLPIIVEQNEKELKTRTTNFGELQFDRRNVLGQGGYGIVYAGTFEGKKVAVRRIQLMDSNPTNNREVLNQQLLNHPNIMQFIHFEKDDDYE
jgi:serine/threonine protein kinase